MWSSNEVWKSQEKISTPINEIKKGDLMNGISALAFSPTGKYLAAAAIDPKH